MLVLIINDNVWWLTDLSGEVKPLVMYLFFAIHEEIFL